MATAAAAPRLVASNSALPQATPSMAQYLEIKAANPDSLLWYRMGDFYELFFEDAVTAAGALGIVLTKRGKHLGEDIPMCGVPVHRADEYLQRLIRAGYRIAICEQLEDPAEARKRGSKAVVRRDVVRLVTPGTLTEDALLDAKTRNFLTAIWDCPAARGKSIRDFAVASLDISTGEFEVSTVLAAELAGELARLQPRELLASDDAPSDSEILVCAGTSTTPVTRVPGSSFDAAGGQRLLASRLGVADLAAFGDFSKDELAAIGALLRYVELTQVGQSPIVLPPRRTQSSTLLTIDAASRRSLELTISSSGDKQASLLGAIDRTVTAAGARELAARLASPLRSVESISARLDTVGFFAERPELRDKLRDVLRSAPDIARAMSRLSLGRGGPRDLDAIRDGLGAAAGLASSLTEAGMAAGLPGDAQKILSRLEGVPAEVADALTRALVDQPPILRREGGFVREGFSSDLDETRALGADSRRVIAALETRYVQETGVKSLKIRHNNLLGYYIEVTAPNAKPLLSPPLSGTFRHRQTMVNAVRFATTELEDLEGRIAASSERALALEQGIFDDLLARIARHQQAISRAAGALAELDCCAGLAELADAEGWQRPEIRDDMTFDVQGGRHPVVEQALRRARSGTFIANDCVLTASDAEEERRGRLWLVTGPNMAGKSTFLRQNALIVVLAQMGSYVPAKVARIGIVDRLFSRVGASDDLARGRSTFMVEMVETAAILNQATERSLVILDEIGRGTATFDGLSIAWATVEQLHDVNRCRTLFATHYHELAALSQRLDGMMTVTMDVKEWHDDIVFLHKVRPGVADRSYGIQVAKLAGVPRAVLLRAADVLARLEKSGRRSAAGGDALDDLPLFAATRAPEPMMPPHSAGPSPCDRALDALNPDDLSPREALAALYQLKALRSGIQN